MAEPGDGLRDLFAIDQGDDLLAGRRLSTRQVSVRGPDHRAARVADSAEEDVGASGTVRRGEHMPGAGDVGDAGQVKGGAIGKRDGAAWSPVPVCPDVTVTSVPRISTKLVGVSVLPTLRPATVSLNASKPGSARLPARAEERERVAGSWGNVELQ